MKNFLLLFLFSFTVSFSQETNIKGFIFDASTNEPLPFATVKLADREVNYTITNQDGQFEIIGDFTTSFIEVRYLGYKTMKVPFSYFRQKNTLFLVPNIFEIGDVVLVANDDKFYAYNTLNKLVQKYRDNDKIMTSKAFLSVSSSARNTPIEQIEGFYTSTQSHAQGLIDLKIKSGRFGQNRSFPFYSLDNNTILTDFQLFKSSIQILPSYPGNMSLSNLKNKYNVKFISCENCSQNDRMLSFVPKKLNGKFFFGTILFDRELLVIKNIQLGINKPNTNGLSPISKEAEFYPKEITMQISFNPMDWEKIQFIDFTFNISYTTADFNELIKTHSFMFFYDYEDGFTDPYFTNTIAFQNDYDKMIALKTSPNFWKDNYQFPKTYTEKRTLAFLKEFGYLINYETAIPSDYIKYIKPAVIAWDKDNRLSWASIKEVVSKTNNKREQPNYKYGRTDIIDHVTHSIAELNSKSKSNTTSKEFIFNYVLNQNITKDSITIFTTRTLFNRGTSFYTGERTLEKLIYLNLSFDIYEFYRQKLASQLIEVVSFDEAKILCDTNFKEASEVIKRMEIETLFGTNQQNLLKWNTKIKTKLNIDNFKLLKNSK